MERLKGARVLVTGGTGFVGSHLIEKLLKHSATIIVLCRSVDPRSYFFSKHFDKKIILAFGDLKDRKRVVDVVTRYEINYIFHLGAQPIVTTALINPAETMESNIMGTVHILEAARLCLKVKGIIVASSDKAYGKSAGVYKESDPLRGDHPYDVSKSATDLIAQTYIATYHLPIVITRFGNIYGPGDLNFTRIVPGILASVITKQPLVVRSDGTYMRDYVYVSDVASAYLFLLQKLDITRGQIFNIAAGERISVIDLIKLSQKILKKKIRFTIANTAVNEIPRQELDWGKIKKLGWKPEVSLKKGITYSYRWYSSRGIQSVVGV